MTKETKVGVICGGISSEREISLRSGLNSFNALKKIGYKNTALIDIKSPDDIFNLKNKIEIAFLLTHGKYGEDGAIQGILEWLKIPYTGSSVLASAISMDKWLTKLIARSNNISTPKGQVINKSHKQNISLEMESIWHDLTKKEQAVFLKPRDDGSSVNTFKIKTLEELKNKINSIDLNASDYIVEEFIPGRELTVSLLEVKNQLKVLPVLELKPKNEFYDFEAKYTKGLTEFILPAKLDTQALKELEDKALGIFTSVGCSSFGRVDFILDQNNIPYLLEINSLPGMTDTSDLPAQANHAGIKYDELVEIILFSARLHKH
ncbi:MAG: hypothetical protein A3B68_03905 [Candidatus Melainabacteria bacterium RIFCSPHIGHO2_02_FULL_34_12]|nr:MAG: hypothetical protein A3B68_03905 [Candidatus Melainabacteria bacterium RIFCSPHIGHO2_02_FULL_34_12]